MGRSLLAAAAYGSAVLDQQELAVSEIPAHPKISDPGGSPDKVPRISDYMAPTTPMIGSNVSG